MAADIWAETRKQVRDALAHKTENPVHVTSTSHPEFHRSFSRLAEKYHLGYVPEILVTDRITLPMPVWMQKIPNGAGYPAGVVIINQGMMDMTGSHLSRAMSPSLETVMAHEFSHLKDGLLHGMVGVYLPVVLPLIAMIGLRMYDKAHARSKKHPNQSKEEYTEQLTQNINDVANEEKEKNISFHVHSDKWQIHPAWKAHMIEGARYMLVAAVGLATGLLASRHMALGAEFRADRRAVEMTGNPEIFKQVLSDLDKAWAEGHKNNPPEMGSVGKIIKRKFQWLLHETVYAHPTDKQRFDHIDKVAERIARERARGLSPSPGIT